MRGAKAMRVGVNIVTESLDFVDSVYDGVRKLDPKHKRCKPHDYKCKLEAIWRHWDDPRFDAAQFVESFLNNQFEDWFYGNLGQLAARSTKNAVALGNTTSGGTFTIGGQCGEGLGQW